MDIINLYEKYNSFFNADLKAVFELLSKTASKNNFKLYLIGGLVRDLLLNENSFDVDITVEGNALDFAQILEKELGAKISSVHKDFGTVKIIINNQKIDLASTRSEVYPKAGHLPKVGEIGCELKKDVLRRDFTVNSLAMSLNKDNFGDLIDYVKGFDDLKSKKIRILHDKSFVDDPTRIIRALKYASRLNFKVEEKTLSLMNDYLKNINYDMCYKRVKQEIKKTFTDCNESCFEKFIDWNVYKLVTTKNITKPKINISTLFYTYKPKYPWLVYFGYFLIPLTRISETRSSFRNSTLSRKERGGFDGLSKLELTKYEKEVIQGAESLYKKSFATDFDLYKAFSAQKIETLLILALFGKGKEVTHFLKNLKNIKLNITGNDLIKLGYKPSKTFSKALDYVLQEKLKKPQTNKNEELKLAEEFFIKH